MNTGESPFTGAFRSLNEVDTSTDIEIVKEFLNDNGLEWPEVRKTLKANRIGTSHPGDEKTSVDDITEAIFTCFPKETSLFHKKINGSVETIEVVRLGIARAHIHQNQSINSRPDRSSPSLIYFSSQ